MAAVFPFKDDEIIDSSGYGAHGHPHQLFTWLRNNDPLRLLEPAEYRPFWAITKHADVMEIERLPEIFTNEPRPILIREGQRIDNRGPDPAVVAQIMARLQESPKLAQIIFSPGGVIRSLVQMDAPDHPKYRALVQPWFTPTNIKRLEDRLEIITREVIDDMMGDGSERTLDFVQDVASLHPLRMICELLGVPRHEEHLILKLTNELFAGEDQEMQRNAADPLSFISTAKDLFDYFTAVTDNRRANPTEDLSSFIANGRIDGEYMPYKELISYYIIVATAGHETTRTAMAGGLHALLTNPAELRKLQGNLSDGMRLAVEEMIRWSTPVNQFSRTAQQDYSLRGKTIKKGDTVGIFYASANRDEEIFDAPFQFKVDRQPNRHLAFGLGPHQCLGNLLARMELRIFFTQLLPRIVFMELAGEPQYLRASFVHGIKRLPVRFKLKPQP